MKHFYSRILGFLLIFLVSYLNNGYSQPGITGAGAISSSGTIVNEYTFLTADAITGASFIKVNNSNLNTNNRFSDRLSNGDLIMIIQMQGATIKGTAQDSTWGAITNYNNCGNYEFAEVESAPNANTINLTCFLKNNYTAAGKVQVVRVPRYASLTINAGATMTAEAWNGTEGGIVAVEVLNNTVINAGGIIDVSGLGFRGGTLQNGSDLPNITGFAVTSADSGGIKGEGIAGYLTDYNKYGGMYGRGAAANAGGGGNSVNAGGGGGANAGNIKYTGNGNPDTSVAGWKTAWNLEYNGFYKSVSSGGGRGGYTWSNKSANPITDAPGSAAWGGDDRLNHGGKGGRPLDYSTRKIFMGGGGGSGQENDNTGGSGGNGGGIAFVISYASVSGSGSIISNGQNGQDNNATSNIGDGPGGGGAGGTIIVTARYGINGISENANGGNGGNQIISTLEAEGPGGGGGGGYIATYKGNPTRQALAGLNGTSNSSSVANFTANGATSGGAGITTAFTTPFYPRTIGNGPIKTGNFCPNTSITMSIIPNDSNIAQADIPYYDSSYTYAWSPSIYTNGSLIDSFLVTTPPVGTIIYTTTISDGYCSRQDTFVIKINPNPVFKRHPIDSICPGQSVTLDVTDSTNYSFSWHPTTGLSCVNCKNPVASPSSTTNYTVLVSTKFCTDSAIQTVKVLLPPNVLFGNHIFCYDQPTQINVNTNNSNTLSWSPGTYLNCTDCKNPQITLLQDTTYIVTVTNAFGCTSSTSFHAIVDKPVISAGTDTTIIETTSGVVHGSGTKQFAWSPTSTLATPDSANSIASPTVTTTYTLMGTDSLGCPAKDFVVVMVESPCILPVIPNAFSPNGNGKNDIYRIANTFIDKIEIFSIYNRWGQLVFQTDDINAGWDGTYKGKPEPVGVYEYYLKIICHGAPQEYKGNVTLLR